MNKKEETKLLWELFSRGETTHEEVVSFYNKLNECGCEDKKKRKSFTEFISSSEEEENDDCDCDEQ